MGLRQLAVCAGCGQGVETLREPCGGEDSAASCPVQFRAAGGLSERAGDGIASRKPLQGAAVRWVQVSGTSGSGASCGPARGM